jgi:hypothetical protein
MLRPRREALQDIGSRLAAFVPDNQTQFNNRSNDSLTTPMTIVKHKPAVVDTGGLKQVMVVKPNIEEPKVICRKTFCCHDRNQTATNSTFDCDEQRTNQTLRCKAIFGTCQGLTATVCQLNTTSVWCRIDQVCGSDEVPECSAVAIELAINASRTTTTTSTTTPSTSK